MESAGRVGPRAPDMHQLHTTDRSLKRIRANEHEALLSTAQHTEQSHVGIQTISLSGEKKSDLRSEVNNGVASLAEEVRSRNKCRKAGGLWANNTVIVLQHCSNLTSHREGKKTMRNVRNYSPYFGTGLKEGRTYLIILTRRVHCG